MVLIVVAGAVMSWRLSTRATLGVNVIHDRNPQYVVNSDGTVRNGFTIRLLNKTAAARTFHLTVDGLPAGTRVDTTGDDPHRDGGLDVAVDSDQTREIRVLVTVPATARLARAIDRVQRHPFPARIVPPVRALFATLAPHTSQPLRAVFSNLAAMAPLAARVFARVGPELNAMVRTTAVATEESRSTNGK